MVKNLLAYPSKIFGLMLLGLMWATASEGADRNRLYGCVTDGNGQPASQARVVAFSGSWFGSKKIKVDVNPASGCYELIGLKDGEYWIYLQDNNYRSGRSPHQGIVELRSGRSVEVNLVTAFPLGASLSAALSQRFRDAASGFAQISGRPIWPPSPDWAWGNYYPYIGPHHYTAPIVPGFSACSTFPMFPSDDFGEYFCEIRDIVQKDVAIAAFQRVTDAIATVLAQEYPLFGPAEKGDCKYPLHASEQKKAKCVQHTTWSESTPAIPGEIRWSRHADLMLFDFDKTQFIELQIAGVKMEIPLAALRQ